MSRTDQGTDQRADPRTEEATAGGSAEAAFDDIPLNRFHLKITALTFGANFSDGYHLGTIGIALSAIAPQMHLGTGWQGLLGASALIGIFVGSIVLGWAGDRIGRQTIYLVDFLLIAVASALQFWADGPVTLLVLRLLIGFGIGADYALGPTLVAEFAPRRHRGGLLASLMVLWTVGYVTAFFLGNHLVHQGADGWRWLLATGAVPAVVVLLLRIGVPESPRWLASRGRFDEARAVVHKYLGRNVDVEALAREGGGSGAGGAGGAGGEGDAGNAGYRRLFGRAYRMRTVFGMLFYNCQVIPYFAVYTFLPIMLAKIGLDDLGSGGDALLNGALLLGGVWGLWLVAKLSRRRLTIWSFGVLTVSLGTIGVWPDGPTPLVFTLFLVFTLVMSAATNLENVYPPELFPTELRGSGVGLLNGASRIGSAAGTFLLPVTIDGLGFRASMVGLAGVLLVGTVSSVLMAPETGRMALEESADAAG